MLLIILSIILSSIQIMYRCPNWINIRQTAISLRCSLLHLVNVFNGLVFYEFHITASNCLLLNRIIQLVTKFILTITDKDTLPCLRIQLGSFILWNMHICLATEDSK